MILLDTNVISEVMRPMPDPNVIRWLDAWPEWEVWTNAVTVAEIRLGITLLPGGKRQNLLLDLAEQMFDQDFHDR